MTTAFQPQPKKASKIVIHNSNPLWENWKQWWRSPFYSVVSDAFRKFLPKKRTCCTRGRRRQFSWSFRRVAARVYGNAVLEKLVAERLWRLSTCSVIPLIGHSVQVSREIVLEPNFFRYRSICASHFLIIIPYFVSRVSTPVSRVEWPIKSI